MMRHPRWVLAIALSVFAVAVPIAYAQQQWKLGVQVSSHDGGGLFVHRVFRGSPAELIGLSAGDVILTLDGRLINNPFDARAYIFDHNRRRVTLVYQHDRRFYQATAEFQVITFGTGPKKTYKLELKGKVDRKEVADPRKGR